MREQAFKQNTLVKRCALYITYYKHRLPLYDLHTYRCDANVDRCGRVGSAILSIVIGTFLPIDRVTVKPSACTRKAKASVQGLKCGEMLPR